MNSNRRGYRTWPGLQLCPPRRSSMGSSIKVLFVSTLLLAAAPAFGVGSPSSDPGLYARLLDECGSSNSAEACKEEARIYATLVKTAGTPSECRGARDSGQSSALAKCIKDHYSGTPSQCRAARDSGQADALTDCLKKAYSALVPNQQQATGLPLLRQQA